MSCPDDPRWDAFARGHPLSSCITTSAGRKLCQYRRWPLDLIGALRAGEVRAGAAVVARRVGPLPFSLVRVEAILPDVEDLSGSTRAVLEAVEAYARSRRAWEIETRCTALEDYPLGGIDYSSALRKALAASGYRPVPVRAGTYIVRIDVNDDTLLSSFSRKCRRDVRKGLREGVMVQQVTKPEGFECFVKYQQGMRARKNLPLMRDAALSAYRVLYDRGFARLFAASYQGRICNMALVDTVGVPRYWFGATAPAAFEKGSPPTGQILHFEIMRVFRDEGLTAYDLGGSPGPEPEEGHPNYTVWRFKHEFGSPFVYRILPHRYEISALGRLVLAAIRRSGRLGLRGRPVTAEMA